MKKLLGLLLGASLLTSCSGDDNGGGASGSITINGDTTELKRGYIALPSDGSNPDFDPRRFLIILTDGSIVNQDGELGLSANTHRLISLNMNTDIAHAGNVQNTTYPMWTLHHDIDRDGPFSEVFLDDDIVVEDGDIESSVEYSSDTMDAGSVTVDKDGSTYHITVHMHNDGNDIDAEFHGKLTEIVLF